MNDMTTGPFDEAAFLSQTTDQEGSTRVTPVPAGTYLAMIQEVKARPWSSERTGKSGVSLDVTYDIIDDGGIIEQQIGRPPRVSHGYFCDLIPGTHQFDFSTGKNVQINRVREAAGQNVAGQAWNPMQLKGAGPVQIVVKQEPSKDDPKDIYNRVVAVGRPSA